MAAQSICGLDEVAHGGEPGYNLARTTDLYSPLLSIVLGPTRIERSSLTASWNGIFLERHLYSPGERNSASTHMHIISVASGAPARFDYRNVTGMFSAAMIRSRELMITPAGLVPDIRLKTSATLDHCAFEESFLRRVADELDHPWLSPTFHPAIKNTSIQKITGMLTDELESEHPASRLYLESLAHALATKYLLLNTGTPLKAKYRVSCLPLRIANRIREKIAANLDQAVSLGDLAKESGYSRAHFLRMFRNTTGLTPHQFVLDLRLRRAQECLRRSNSSIVDVALSCGFCSQSHMTTVFRKHLELTPNQFRRSVRSTPGTGGSYDLVSR